MNPFFSRRQVLTSAFAVAVIATLSPVDAMAQTAAPAWPQKPVRLIAPFSAGSTVDTMARLIAKPLAALLGQPVIVENRGGAGGNIGVDLVAKAAPDGYTLGIGTTGPMAINPSLMARVPYVATRDLAPIALLASGPIVLVTSPSIPARNVAELIALLKANPGKYSFSSAGIGSTGHLAGELFRLRTGTTLQHIPYKGNQDALVDVLGGQVAMTFSGLQPLLSNIQAGKLRALMVAGDKRLSAIPDVPTGAEAGVAEAEVMPWYGLIAPAGLPPAVVTLLNHHMATIMAQPDIAEKFRATGSEPQVGTPESFGKLIAHDGQRWADVIKKAGIQPQ
jgi:tripartite-type tricarboxylate transporter receptor subunit TctC